MRLRPKRSISQPPSSPKIPPASAVIQRILPTQSRALSGVKSGPSNSRSAGLAMTGSISSS